MAKPEHILRDVSQVKCVMGLTMSDGEPTKQKRNNMTCPTEILCKDPNHPVPSDVEKAPCRLRPSSQEPQVPREAVGSRLTLTSTFKELRMFYGYSTRTKTELERESLRKIVFQRAPFRRGACRRTNSSDKSNVTKTRPTFMLLSAERQPCQHGNSALAKSKALSGK